MATLPPICTPSAAPTGKLMDSEANLPCRCTERTVALPCTIPVGHHCERSLHVPGKVLVSNAVSAYRHAALVGHLDAQSSQQRDIAAEHVNPPVNRAHGFWRMCCCRRHGCRESCRPPRSCIVLPLLLDQR